MKLDVRGWLSVWAMRSAVLVMVFAATGACTSGPQPVPIPSSTLTTSSTAPAPVPVSTTQSLPDPESYVPPTDFAIEIGAFGVTYELDGSPPTGPTSFVVLADGSVAVADTMAAGRGEPRILLFDDFGDLVDVVDLAGFGVVSMVDLATDGERIAVLDVELSRDRYSVLTVDRNGNLESTIELPPGFRFGDGLTGIVWGGLGVLLEFEFGARYASLSNDGEAAFENPVWDGKEVVVLAGAGKVTVFQVGSVRLSVDRMTDLGGATFLGLSPDGSVVVVLDEVEMRGGAFFVGRTIQRYTAEGDLLAEIEIDISTQVIDIQHPLTLAPDGSVIWLDARSDGLHVITLDV